MTDQGEDGPGLDPSFRAIFEAELSYVCRSLRRCGIRERDIEDLAHDVFLAAHLGFASFDRKKPLKPWLFGIAFRIASHHRRRAGYQREALGADDAPDPADSAPLADELLDDARKRRLVLEILETLDLDRRAVLVMHDLDGLAMRDIAEALGIPVFTGYSRLRAAREQFAAAARRYKIRGGER